MFFILLCIVIVIVFTLEIYQIACQKGASGGKYVLLSILCLPLALLLLIALPDRNAMAYSDANRKSRDELPEL